jgi:hypothetical protein
MKAGDIVLWSAPDCEPEKGIVVKVTEKRVYIRAQGYSFERNLSDGVFTVLPDDIKFVASVLKPMMEESNVSAKTKNVKAKAKKVVAKKTKAKAKAGPARQGSKMAEAISIYNASKDKERKDVIQLFIDKVGLTKAGASTYYQIAKKKAG